MNRLNSFLLFLLFIGTLSCASSEQLTEDDEQSETSEGQVGPIEETESGIELDRYRSGLADVYASLDHDIPESFLETYEGGRSVERDPFDGFRVQIHSSREVETADSIAGEFRVWADTTLSGDYKPDSYVSFNPPRYKVHVGDFHNRDQANEFSSLVKEIYPDAWVVHDRIEPSEVPPDTLRFEIKEEDEGEEEDK